MTSKNVMIVVCHIRAQNSEDYIFSDGYGILVLSRFCSHFIYAVLFTYVKVYNRWAKGSWATFSCGHLREELRFSVTIIHPQNNSGDHRYQCHLTSITARTSDYTYLCRHRLFYKVKGAVICRSRQFAPHKTDVATRWPWYVPAEINQFCMADSIVKGLEAFRDLFTPVLLGVISTRGN